MPEVSSPEGYRIDVDGVVVITAPTAAGIHHGSRTLLLSWLASGGAEAGTVIDEPALPVRSLHVDAARKYFSLAWLKRQVKLLSWLKLNEIQFHFSENEGFRLES